jgi:hypothetical protein
LIIALLFIIHTLLLLIFNLGEGSYGSVYKALHKESGQVLAIKQVPVESDLGIVMFDIIALIC